MSKKPEKLVNDNQIEVMANIRLVAEIAGKHLDQGLDLPDLICEGVTGLEQAVSLLDNAENTDSATYASFWIDGAVVGALTAQRMVDKFVTDFEGKFSRRPNLAEITSFEESRLASIHQALGVHALQSSADVKVTPEIVKSPTELEPTKPPIVWRSPERNPIKPAKMTAEKADRNQKSAEINERPHSPHIELNEYLDDDLQKIVLRRRYQSSEGLYTYSEIGEFLIGELGESGDPRTVSSICRKALKILAKHGVTTRDLVSTEVLEVINRLPSIQERVIEARFFGLNENMPLSWNNIGQLEGIPVSQVRYIEQRALENLHRICTANAEKKDIKIEEEREEERLYIDSKLLSALDEQSQQAIVLRYGLDGQGLRTHSTIAQELDVELDDVILLISLSLDTLKSKRITPKQFLLVYPRLFSQLDETEKKTIEKCFAFNGTRMLYYDEIAEVLEIPASQVCNEEEKILKRLIELPDAMRPERVKATDSFRQKMRETHKMELS